MSDIFKTSSKTGQNDEPNLSDIFKQNLKDKSDSSQTVDIDNV